MNVKPEDPASLAIVHVTVKRPQATQLCRASIFLGAQVDEGKVKCGLDVREENRDAVESMLNKAELTYDAEKKDGDGYTLLVELGTVMTSEQALAKVATAFAEATLSKPTYEFELLRPDGGRVVGTTLYVHHIADTPYATFYVYEVLHPEGYRTSPEQWQQYGMLLDQYDLVAQTICFYGGAMIQLTPQAAVNYVAAITKIVGIFPQ
jgi:hypothetical protein